MPDPEYHLVRDFLNKRRKKESKPDPVHHLPQFSPPPPVAKRTRGGKGSVSSSSSSDKSGNGIVSVNWNHKIKFIVMYLIYWLFFEDSSGGGIVSVVFNHNITTV